MAYALWGLAGFVFGCLIALLNFRLTVRCIQRSNQSKEIMKVSILRQVFNIVALVVAFLVGKWFEAGMMALLIGTALGLTLPAQLLALRFYRRRTGGQQPQQSGEQEE